MKSRNALIALIGLFIVVLQMKAATGPGSREKLAIELQCSPAMGAQTGDTVTLRCSTKPRMDVSKDLTVEWLYWDADSEKPVDVFLFRDREEDLEDQDKRFKGKTVLLPKELRSGNFSIQMRVDDSHSGTYFCTVKDGDVKDSCSTTLTVRPREPDPVTQPNQRLGDGIPVTDEKGSDPGTIWGTIGGIIAIIIIIIAIIIIRQCRKKRPKKNTTETQGTGEEKEKLNGDSDSSESSV